MICVSNLKDHQTRRALNWKTTIAYTEMRSKLVNGKSGAWKMVFFEKIINEFNKFPSKYHKQDVFNDWVSLMACVISNQVYYRDDMERLYINIINKYIKEEVDRFCYMQYLLIMCFEERIDDYLGKIYMQIDAGNKRTGQFFTPYHLSKLNAEIILQGYDGKEVMINEPSCGACGMILAVADVLNSKGYNYQLKMDVTANDIDFKSVCMSYVQLSLCGISAKVVQGNTLLQEESLVLYTPSYILKRGLIR